MAQNPNDIPKVDRYINHRRVPQKQTVRMFSSDPRASNKAFLLKNNVIIIDRENEEVIIQDVSYSSPSETFEETPSTYVLPDAINPGVNDAPQIIGITFSYEKTTHGDVKIFAYALLPDVNGIVDYEATIFDSKGKQVQVVV